MKIRSVSIANYRCVPDLTIALGEQPAILVGENGSGKTTILDAIERGVGADRSFSREDFRDIEQPIEISVTLTDFSAYERGELAEAITFEDPPHVLMKVRAVWNRDQDTAEVEHTLPDKGGRSTRRDEREAVPAVRLGAQRDVGRLIAFGRRRGVLNQLLEGNDLSRDLAEALDLVNSGTTRLGASHSFRGLLDDAGRILARLHQPALASRLTVGHAAATERELMNQLDLMVETSGVKIPIHRDSSGAAQLTFFAFLLKLLAQNTGSILLVDEPEISLHPHAQRSLMREIKALQAQVVIATHSSNLLERADPRRVIRLLRHGKGVSSKQATEISDSEARKLARFTNAQTAEAFFARAAVLVEGPSDKVAIEALAERQGCSLDAMAVSIVELGGGETFGTFLRLLGPRGLGLRLLGLCDKDKETRWANALLEARVVAAATERDMDKAGFFVCNVDLEDELIRAVGEEDVTRLVQETEKDAWKTYTAQPNNKAKSGGELLRGFISSRDRKIRYAPLLVDALDLKRVPDVLSRLMNHVKG